MQQDRWTLALAALFVLAAVLTLAVWIPNDIETGLIERFRREVMIGDALAPTGAAVGVLIAALALGATSWFRPDPFDDTPDRQSIAFLLRMAVVLVLGLVLMVFTGPVVVESINGLGGEIGTYRQLRDTVPYKYLGFAAGGFVLVFGAIRVVENRFSMAAAGVAIGAVVVLGFIYDVPFDNLLLPPNGDQ